MLSVPKWGAYIHSLFLYIYKVISMKKKEKTRKQMKEY
ncbi:hypothetical protein bcere0019_6750 [Bacillus cereus Rock3-28]|nr:hypothetical protein bcere0019_6750 [Bacillus cereus Rock3-28]